MGNGRGFLQAWCLPTTADDFSVSLLLGLVDQDPNPSNRVLIGNRERKSYGVCRWNQTKNLSQPLPRPPASTGSASRVGPDRGCAFLAGSFQGGAGTERKGHGLLGWVDCQLLDFLRRGIAPSHNSERRKTLSRPIAPGSPT